MNPVSGAGKVPGVEEMQTTLADEHSAVYLFGLLGARISERKNPALFKSLTDSFESHRRNRDDLSALIAGLGETPVAAAIAYDPPGPVNTPTEIEHVAGKLEQRMTLRYGSLVENTTREQRIWAITALQSSAIRELSYGRPPRDLPGM